MKKILFALVALLGFVACDTNEPTNEYKLNLLVDKAEIFADGKDAVTFIVKDWEGNVLEDATIHFADTNEALAGKTFTTKYPGEYNFYAKLGAQKSEVWQVYAVEAEEPGPGPEPGPEALTLSVSPATIVADGVEKVVFSLKQGDNAVTGFEVYNAADNSKLASNEFSTTVAGTYSFYAKYEDETSNTVEVKATEKVVEEEKPITLEASATTIKANGVDYVKFTVKQDGADVTSASAIYVNGGKLNGARFVTTTPGSYTVYAEKGSQKSNEINITAEEVTETGKTIVFADGVTLTSGWYDVNKFKEGNNGDIQMCWAASASNIIQWWQDRYVAQGGTLPSTAINGPSNKTYETGCKYQLALMDMFHDEWDNIYGGYVFHAVPWYFEGINVCDGWGYQAQPYTNGGYFKSAANSFSYNDYDLGYTTDCNGYGNWGNGTNLEGVDRLKKFTDYVVEFMDRGMMSLTVSLAENIMSLHHATTLWGYEIDNATGLLTRVWLTDSDDLITEPKSAILHEYTVSIGEGKSHVKLSCDQVRYKNVWVVGLIPVSGPKL